MRGIVQRDIDHRVRCVIHIQEDLLAVESKRDKRIRIRKWIGTPGCSQVEVFEACVDVGRCHAMSMVATAVRQR